MTGHRAPRRRQRTASLLLFAGAVCLGAALNSLVQGLPAGLTAALAAASASLIAPCAVLLARAGRDGTR